MSQKTVLITGTSAGGIGSALAIAFQKSGLRVFATARNPEKAAHLAKLPGLEVLTLDVTSAASIAEAVKVVSIKTEGKGLDILVNNSGRSYRIPLLDASLEEGRKVFEVNLWGVVSMVQAFAPQLIQNKGTIVNVGSVAGLVNTPWLGLYAASKAAINLLSDTLRLELAPFGVRVITTMAGAVTSKLGENGDFEVPSDSVYTPIKTAIEDTNQNPDTMDADVFASKVVADVLGGARGRIWRGKLSTTASFVSIFMPSFILDRILVSGRGLNELASWLKTHGNVKKA